MFYGFSYRGAGGRMADGVGGGLAAPRRAEQPGRLPQSIMIGNGSARQPAARTAIIILVDRTKVQSHLKYVGDWQRNEGSTGSVKFNSMLSAHESAICFKGQLCFSNGTKLHVGSPTVAQLRSRQYLVLSRNH